MGIRFVLIDEFESYAEAVSIILESHYVGSSATLLEPQDFLKTPEDADIIFVEHTTLTAISGSEIVRRLRPSHPSAYFIVWSINMMTNDVGKGEFYEAAADHVACKVGMKEELIELVNLALQEKGLQTA